MKRNRTRCKPERPEYAQLFVVSPSDTFKTGQASSEVSNLVQSQALDTFQIQTSLMIDTRRIRSFQEDHRRNVDGTITNDTARALTDALRTRLMK